MVDEPPGSISASTPKDWAKLVGQQPERSSTTTPPVVAGGVSFETVDAPPDGNSVDVLQQQTESHRVWWRLVC